MTASGAADPMQHFGRQVRKARLARGWTIREAGRELGYVAGSRAVMADQMEHLLTVTALPSVTIQVVQAGVAHCGASGAFEVAVGGAYVETAFGGMVFEDTATVQGLVRRFDTIRAQAWSAPESLNAIRRIRDEHRQRVA
jgi:hypothetical protein